MSNKAAWFPATREEELSKTDFTHGEAGYDYHRCRGPVCREAHAAATVRTREERREYTAQFGLPEGVSHGASAYTNWGCRCGVCRDAHNEECAKYRV